MRMKFFVRDPEFAGWISSVRVSGRVFSRDDRGLRGSSRPHESEPGAVATGFPMNRRGPGGSMQTWMLRFESAEPATIALAPCEAKRNVGLVDEKIAEPVKQTSGPSRVSHAYTGGRSDYTLRFASV
jgi:hypothetical protein